MNRLVHILYRIDSRKRTKRGLKLREHPKDIMIGPPAGGTQGNPCDNIMVGPAGGTLKREVTERRTSGGQRPVQVIT